MTVVALASLKGSPGVTTAATALAASWPRGASGPTGRSGSLRRRPGSPLRLDDRPRLGLAVRRGPAVARTPTPSGTTSTVSPGAFPSSSVSRARRRVANEKAWPAVAEALGALDADVVVDAGRLLPNFAGGVGDVLAHSDVLVDPVPIRRSRGSSISGRPCPAW